MAKKAKSKSKAKSVPTSNPPSILPPKPLSKLREAIETFWQMMALTQEFGPPHMIAIRDHTGPDRVTLTFAQDLTTTLEVPYPNTIPDSEWPPSLDDITNELTKHFISAFDSTPDQEEEQRMIAALRSFAQGLGEKTEAQSVQPRRNPFENATTRSFDVTNLLTIDNHPLLGTRTLRAIGEPGCPDQWNPTSSYIALLHTSGAYTSVCICIARGPLDKLRHDETFKRHVNEQASLAIRCITSPCDIHIRWWKPKQFFLGEEGETPIIRKVMIGSEARIAVQARRFFMGVKRPERLLDCETVITPDVPPPPPPPASLQSDEQELHGDEESQSGKGKAVEVLEEIDEDGEESTTMQASGSAEYVSNEEKVTTTMEYGDDEVDQEIEALAVQCRFWSCHAPEGADVGEVEEPSE